MRKSRKWFLRPIRIIGNLLFVGCLLLTSCESKEERDLEAAAVESARGHFRIALSHLDKVLLRSPGSEESLRAAREAARITFYDLKDFSKAIEYNRKIILYSRDSEERRLSQKTIAETYFSQLNDYSKAIVELNKLILLLTDPKDLAHYKMSVARAYYYQNNFSQAENEVDEFLRRTKEEKERFDLMVLKGNIALAQKNLPKAIELYRAILLNFPRLSQKENVALTLAVCYEELKDYKNAIATLEILKKSHPVPEYIDLRIKRLSERQKNAPGARGPRK